MFKATIDANIFKETIEAVSAIARECRLHVDDKGIRTITIDPSNVAMVSLNLEAEAFSSYSADMAELGLDMEKIREMTKMIKDDVVSLQLDDDGKKLKISFGGYEYSIALLDTKTIRKDPNKPQIQLPARFEMSGSKFNEVLKNAAMISDKLALSVNAETGVLTLKADGDSNHIQRDLSGDDVHFIESATVRSLFTLDYLKDMGKVIDHAETVEICLGENHPIYFTFSYADKHGTIDYLLAPRIEV